MKWIDSLPESWVITDIGTLCTLIQYGLTATANNNSEGVLYLRISDIDDEGRAHLREPKYVPESVANIEKYGLAVGDIVIDDGIAIRAALYLQSIASVAPDLISANDVLARVFHEGQSGHHVIRHGVVDDEILRAIETQIQT